MPTWSLPDQVRHQLGLVRCSWCLSMSPVLLRAIAEHHRLQDAGISHWRHWRSWNPDDWARAQGISIPMTPCSCERDQTQIITYHWCRYGGLFTQMASYWWIGGDCANLSVQRPRYKAGTSYPVIWVDVPLMDISSIMNFLAKGRTPNFMLSKPVLDYIKKEGLYQWP